MGRQRGRRCLVKGHKPRFKYSNIKVGNKIMDNTFCLATVFSKCLEHWHTINPGAGGSSYFICVCCFPITSHFLHYLWRVLALYMCVVFPLLSVTIDWQEMEGSTYLATPLPPPKSINHRGYPLRLEMEAPERKQLVLGAKKHRLGKCTKDNRRGFIENGIFFDLTDLNGGF